LHWRQEKTLVNSNKIHCVTFDQLYERLRAKLEEGQWISSRLSGRK
jgi:hypothetical protein